VVVLSREPITEIEYAFCVFCCSGKKREDKGQLDGEIEVEAEFSEEKIFKFRRPVIKKGDPIFSKIIKRERAEAERKGKWNIFSKSSKAGKASSNPGDATEKGSSKMSGSLPFFKKKNEADDDEFDVIQQSEKRLFQEKDSDEDEDEEIGCGDCVECGTLRLMQLYEVNTTAEVGDGDSRYERLIQKIWNLERKTWIHDKRKYFNDHTSYQAHKLFLASSVLNSTLRGYTITPAVVVDMTYPCTQHLLTACKQENISLLIDSRANAENAGDNDGDNNNAQKHYVEPSYEQSQVLCVLDLVYNSVAMLTPSRSVRVYAGGGVSVPPDEFLIEAADGGSTKVSHWARGDFCSSIFRRYLFYG
jgi:hypothetical protein